MLKKWFKRYIKRDWWEVRPCGFPYKEGYATFNPWKNTMLDSGLTKEYAQEICDELNKD